MSKTPSSGSHPLFVWACCMLLGVFVTFSNCTDPPKQEGPTEPSVGEQITTQEGFADTRPETIGERAIEPTTEAKVEQTTEKLPTEKQVDTGADGSPSEPTTDTRDGGPTTPCTGVNGPYPSVDGGPPPERDLPEMIPEGETCKYTPGQCPGATTPPWVLEDFQPQSCGYKKKYHLKAFRGYVTVVALLSGW